MAKRERRTREKREAASLSTKPSTTTAPFPSISLLRSSLARQGGVGEEERDHHPRRPPSIQEDRSIGPVDKDVHPRHPAGRP